jgi:holliday junction DNA helicase RuvA
MIAHLRGTLLEKHPNQIIVDVGGVGYDVLIPVSTFSVLPDVGGSVELRIHTHVREDAIVLFGFRSGEEKAVFERLISVSGIGPKLGITILSGLQVADLVMFIRTGQLERLVKIPGVGKKTAERLIVELRDKLEGIGASPSTVAAPASRASLSPVEEDVLSALLNLGCQRAAAEAAIAKALPQVDARQFEPLFRKALEYIR